MKNGSPTSGIPGGGLDGEEGYQHLRRRSHFQQASSYSRYIQMKDGEKEKAHFQNQNSGILLWRFLVPKKEGDGEREYEEEVEEEEEKREE